MKPQDFQKLQKYWYQKLSDSGFKDIEFIKTSLDVYRNLNSNIERIAKEEYWNCIYFHAHHEETHYRNPVERFILTRYSSGFFIKIIVKELKEQGTHLSRKTVAKIIHHYEKIWGLG